MDKNYFLFLIFFVIPLFLQSMDSSESEQDGKYDDLINSILASPDFCEKSEIEVVAPQNNPPSEIHQKEPVETKNTIAVDVTEKLFPSQNQPVNHSLRFLQLLGELKCQFCNKILSSKKILEHHTQAFHSGAYTCDENNCNLAFPSRSSLNAHKRRKHSKLKYKCEKCSKLYALEQDLYEHLRKKHSIENITQLNGQHVWHYNFSVKSSNS